MKKMLLMLLLILPLLGCVKEAEKTITIKDNYEDGEEITIVRHPREVVKFKCSYNLEALDMMCKKI